jgi:hypothetical protein
MEKSFEKLIKRLGYDARKDKKRYINYLNTNGYHNPKTVEELKKRMENTQLRCDQYINFYTKYWTIINDEIAQNQYHMCRINHNLDSLIDFFDALHLYKVKEKFYGHVYVLKDLNSGLYKLGITELDHIDRVIDQTTNFPYEIVFLIKTKNLNLTHKFFRYLYMDKAVRNPYSFREKKFNKKSGSFFEFSDSDLNLLSFNSLPGFIREVCRIVKPINNLNKVA